MGRCKTESTIVIRGISEDPPMMAGGKKQTKGFLFTLKTDRKGMVTDMPDEAQKLLDSVQGYARVRTLTPEDMKDTLNTFVERIGIRKTYLEGTRVRCDMYAEGGTKADTVTLRSTQFTAFFAYGKWRIESIERKATRPRPYYVEMSKEAAYSALRGMVYETLQNDRHR